MSLRRGFVNRRNACYRSAVLQCLDCLTPPLSEWGGEVPAAVAARSLLDAIRTRDDSRLLRDMAARFPQFSTGAPADAHEWLLGLLEHFEGAVGAAFEGATETTISTACAHDANRHTETFRTLLLPPVPCGASLADAVERAMGPCDVRSTCDVCGAASAAATKRSRVTRWPRQLVVHNPRYAPGAAPGRRVVVPRTFRRGSSPTYGLRGYVTHAGSAAGGHYVAVVRGAGEVWWRCDDARCVRCEPDPAGAYLIFYSAVP